MEAVRLRNFLAGGGSVVFDGVFVSERVMEDPATYKVKSSLEHPVATEEVIDWPEYQRFIDRLGVRQQRQCFKLVITLEAGHLVTIQQSYFAKDANQ